MMRKYHQPRPHSHSPHVHRTPAAASCQCRRRLLRTAWPHQPARPAAWRLATASVSRSRYRPARPGRYARQATACLLATATRPIARASTATPGPATPRGRRYGRTPGRIRQHRPGRRRQLACRSSPASRFPACGYSQCGPDGPPQSPGRLACCCVAGGLRRVRQATSTPGRRGRNLFRSKTCSHGRRA